MKRAYANRGAGHKPKPSDPRAKNLDVNRQVQLPPDRDELLGLMQGSLESLAVELGLLVASNILEDEVTRLCGARYQRQADRTHTGNLKRRSPMNSDRNSSPDDIPIDGSMPSRRDFLALGPATLAAVAVADPFIAGRTIMAAEGGKESMSPVSKLSITIAGEPLAYPATPNPEVSSVIMTLPPGTTSEWMTHPVQVYIYVLEGTLTVEFDGGPDQEFKAGQSFLQARSKWHRGRNKGDVPMRFLAVCIGAKDVPIILHPPGVK